MSDDEERVDDSVPSEEHQSKPPASDVAHDPAPGTPTVFLDRDGTLIEERHYPVRHEDIVPVEGVDVALARLTAAGYRLIILTNQSAVARGMISEEQLGELHDRLIEQLEDAGARIAAIYYAPHHPDGSNAAYAYHSSLRKPGRGMLDLALHEHPTDLARSAFIGDAVRDLFVDVDGAGPRILVRSGHALSDEDEQAANHVADDLPAAIEWLLGARDNDAS